MGSLLVFRAITSFVGIAVSLLFGAQGVILLQGHDLSRRQDFWGLCHDLGADGVNVVAGLMAIYLELKGTLRWVRAYWGSQLCNRLKLSAIYLWVGFYVIGDPPTRSWKLVDKGLGVLAWGVCVANILAALCARSQADLDLERDLGDLEDDDIASEQEYYWSGSLRRATSSLREALERGGRAPPEDLEADVRVSMPHVMRDPDPSGRTEALPGNVRDSQSSSAASLSPAVRVPARGPEPGPRLVPEDPHGDDSDPDSLLEARFAAPPGGWNTDPARPTPLSQRTWR